MKPAGLALMVSLTVSLAVALCPACAGPGEAGRGRSLHGNSATNRAAADYVVLIWFRDDDPLGTFEYQTYDVRAGEYTPAVDDWIALIRKKYPRYAVRAVPVDLERENGATEKLKVGAVIHRELLLAAARSGVVVGAPPMRIGRGPDSGPHRISPGSPLTETPGAGGSTDINPVTPRMPFPYPYPRPHP